MLRLVIADDRGAKTIVPLVRDEITIGRAESNTIRLTERNVSRSHAKIRLENGLCFIEDLKSYCGVTVNGTKIKEAVEVRLGDKIGIGDYVVVIETEIEGIQAVTQPGVRLKTGSEPAEASPLPARLVMLTEPRPGDEYPLKKDGSVRLGRSDELEIPLNHRSVSREHAEIVGDGNGYRIADLQSINGTIVNGSKTAERELQSGDIVRLGEVVLRFVAEGESYQFDAREAAKQIRAAEPMSRASFWALTGVTEAVAALVVTVYWYRGRESTATAEVTVSAPRTQSTLRRQQQIDKWVRMCRMAIEGERYAEAVAHAVKALEASPQDKEAKQCKELAERNNEQEQIYVRGKSALASNDPEGAYAEFKNLEENSFYWQREEIIRSAREVAQARLNMARSLIGSDNLRAGVLAVSVLNMKAVPGALRQMAVNIRDEAKSEPEPAVETRAKRQISRRAEAASRSRTRVYQPPSAATYGNASNIAATAASGPSASSASPFQVARTCLSRGDNQCIIRALEGKAHTAEELGLLIETYRSLGNNREARKNMDIYLTRFPLGSRANIYRTILKQNK